MKTRWILAMLVAIVVLVGCDDLARNVADPNSSLNVTIGAVNDIVPVIGATATATGTPWGATVGIAAAILTTAVGVYNNHRKKVVINEKDAHLENTEMATRAIIAAIEEVSSIPLKGGDTLGDAVKEKVAQNLRSVALFDAYKIGKAIITGLKK